MGVQVKTVADLIVAATKKNLFNLIEET